MTQEQFQKLLVWDKKDKSKKFMKQCLVFEKKFNK